MKIYISAGTGYGQTLLSAFDSALMEAGVHNFNVLVLSSIIPPKSEIIEKERLEYSADIYGHRLYVVRADIRSREINKYIASALGWYQLPDGRGVFVEHEMIGETESAVKSEITSDVKKSLTDLCINRNYPIDHEKMKMKINIAKVTDKATCSLVVAVYMAKGWE